ncbi:peptidylprolyl isomerase [Pseudoteredinibacter isoporae]|uniref:peptidylprolyl isomerase n=1 Tax=Pseudoteredinibacter isoporae TaxID=570281 RepID=UPI0031020191
MKLNKLSLVLACVFITTLTACNDQAPSIATVNGKGITAEEFDAFLAYRNLKPKDDAQKQKLLDEYLQREALADAVSALNDDSNLVKAEINELRKQVQINRYFETYLEKRVDEKAVTAYYDANPEEFEKKKVHVAHILVRVGPLTDDTQRQAKRNTLQEAQSKIQAGMDFKEAAKLYSEDKISAKKGGDIGWIQEGSIAPNFSELAFKLPVGEVSNIIETPFGYHLLTVVEEPSVIRRPYNAAKGEIRYKLRNQYKDAEISRLLETTQVMKEG